MKIHLGVNAIGTWQSRVRFHNAFALCVRVREFHHPSKAAGLIKRKESREAGFLLHSCCDEAHPLQLQVFALGTLHLQQQWHQFKEG